MDRLEAIALLEDTLGRALTPAETGQVSQVYSFNPNIELPPAAVLAILDETQPIPAELGGQDFQLLPEEILVAQVEAVTGRPLTTDELGKLRSHLDLRGYDIIEAGGAYREDDQIISLTAELFGVITGKMAVGEVLPAPPRPPPVIGAVQEAAGEGVDPAFLEGLPEQLTDDLTGEADLMGRPRIGNINGTEMVWDPTLGVTAAFLDDATGPLPIGAAALGITEAGQSIVSNLFEAEQFIQKFKEDQQAIAEKYAGAQPVAPTLTGRINEGFFGGEGETPPFIPPGRINRGFYEPGSYPVYDDLLEYGVPQYFPENTWIDFATKGPAYQTFVQQALVDGGLLREADMVDGVWTVDAARAMEIAMFESNATGGSQSWVDILEDRKIGVEAAAARRPGPGGGAARSPLEGRVLVIPPFEEPDYDSLTQEVKRSFRTQLNRDPVAWELALLADNLNGNYRSQYDAQVVGLKAEFEAGNRAILRGGPTVEGTASIESVDPLSRLLEEIEERYAAELELGESRIDKRNDVSNVFSILTQTQRILSGGTT